MFSAAMVIASNAAAPECECGSGMLCCKVYALPELAKPPGVRHDRISAAWGFISACAPVFPCARVEPGQTSSNISARTGSQTLLTDDRGRTSMAERAGSTTLRNAMTEPSPVWLKTRPWFSGRGGILLEENKEGSRARSFVYHPTIPSHTESLTPWRRRRNSNVPVFGISSKALSRACSNRAVSRGFASSIEGKDFFHAL
jgi:hypothetical protein